MATAISAAELAQLHRSGKQIDLIDVRTPAEFQQVHVEFAENVPLTELDPTQVLQARKRFGEFAALRDLPHGRPREAGL